MLNQDIPQTMTEILVVDDDQSVLASIGTALQEKNYRPVLIHCPLEAMSILWNDPNRFGLILLDWKLKSHIDGDMVFRLFKRFFPNSKCKTVVISSHTAVASKFLIRHGVYETLKKPFTCEALYDTIERALNLKHPENPRELAPIGQLSWKELRQQQLANKIVDAIEATRSLAEASRLLHCSTMTLRRWLKLAQLYDFVIKKERKPKWRLPDAA